MPHQTTTSRIGRGLSTFAELFAQSSALQRQIEARKEEQERDLEERERDRQLRAAIQGSQFEQGAIGDIRQQAGPIQTGIAGAESRAELEAFRPQVTGLTGETVPIGDVLAAQGGPTTLGMLARPDPVAQQRARSQLSAMQQFTGRGIEVDRIDQQRFGEELRKIAADNPNLDPGTMIQMAIQATGVTPGEEVTAEVSAGAEPIPSQPSRTERAISAGQEEARLAQVETAQSLALDFLEKGEAAKALDEVRALNSSSQFIQDAATRSAAGDVSGIDDVALVTTFARVLEPGGRAVTDSDFNNITGALGLPPKLIADMKRMVGLGQGAFLTNEMRQRMAEITAEKLEAARGEFGKFEDRFKRLGRQRNIPDDILDEILLGAGVPAPQAESTALDVVQGIRARRR